MKRAIICGFVSMVSTCWAIAILACAGENLVNSWNGNRLWESVRACGLGVPLVCCLAVLALSLAGMCVEFLRPEK